ncbi:angiotensin-converting enzyme-like protein Ace3 [Oratosquilla oratoria]|uniref:angiotensin-converting enzyme-like protein Ace3 n=1 Tax=Oratosquilla oratoria TaxID=337810 RepID=UPI003F76AF1E
MTSSIVTSSSVTIVIMMMMVMTVGEAEASPTRHFMETEIRHKRGGSWDDTEWLSNYIAEAEELLPNYKAKAEELLPNYKAEADELLPNYKAKAEELLPNYKAEADELLPNYNADVEEWLSNYNAMLGLLRRQVDRTQWEATWRPWDKEVQDRVLRTRGQLAVLVEDGRAWVKGHFSQVTKLPQRRSTLTQGTTRMIDLICQGPSYSPGLARQLAYLLARMRRAYAGVHLVHGGRIYHGEGVGEAMRNSRDAELLLGLWTKWREALGPRLRPVYLEVVDVMNQAARRAGYHDMGVCWREELEMAEGKSSAEVSCSPKGIREHFKSPGDTSGDAKARNHGNQDPGRKNEAEFDESPLRQHVKRLYVEVLPEYRLLHALARQGLVLCYGEEAREEEEEENEEGLRGRRTLPAHLLGDMWAENWQSLRDLILRPSKAKASCRPSSGRNLFPSPRRTLRPLKDNFVLGTRGAIRPNRKPRSSWGPDTPEKGEDTSRSPGSRFESDFERESPAGGRNSENDFGRLLPNSDNDFGRLLPPNSENDFGRLLPNSENDFGRLLPPNSENDFGRSLSNSSRVLRPSTSGVRGEEDVPLDFMEAATQSLCQKGYSVKDMVEEAESFYRSLGFPELPGSFWAESVLGEPPHSNFSCHPTSYDLGNRDYRMVLCGPVGLEGLAAAHHELGHIHYYASYAHLPSIFRDGANSAFHEAVGDALVMSALTPENLWRRGHLTSPDLSSGEELGYLATVALQKLPLLVYARVLEEWRWGVMEGQVPVESLNSHWWKLREDLQGVSAPVARAEDDLDAVAKFHVTDNLPYIRYMLGVVLQFQIHKGLCEAKYGIPLPIPLHRCNVAGSRRAGEKLRRAMRRGRSVPWQDTLEELTGSRSLRVEPLKEYLGPFLTWLRQEVLRRNLTVGW